VANVCKDSYESSSYVEGRDFSTTSVTINCSRIPDTMYFVKCITEVQAVAWNVVSYSSMQITPWTRQPVRKVEHALQPLLHA